MSALTIRLGSRHRRVAYATFALLWASGASWLLFHYFFRVEGDFGPEAHPLEAWWLRLHGLMAMFALVAVGSLATNHIRLAWKRRKNLGTGLAMLAATGWLGASGYALYYFASEANEAWLPLTHWVAGLALPLAAFLHIRRGRRKPARKRRHARPTPRNDFQPPATASAPASPLFEPTTRKSR